MSETIRSYWEERAKTCTGTAATTDDVYMRELEISTLIKTISALDLPKPAQLLDLGCGDGYATLRIAEAIPDLACVGIDYSEGMLQLADARLNSKPALSNRVKLLMGDAVNLKEACGDSLFDLALTERCLINFDSAEMQSRAIAGIAQQLRPGGFYIAVENFIEGHNAMNAARDSVGLPPIPVRFHNLYFKEGEFLQSAYPFFEDIQLKDFSSAYYYATRVIYSKMCSMKGETPDYRHEIHQLAVGLPWHGKFSPIRMAVMRRKADRQSDLAAIGRFEKERAESIQKLGGAAELKELSRQWVADVSKHKYSYNFSWLGRPFIQFPQDILAMQEIIWQVKPDLIIETGIAHGGGLIYYSSILELMGGDGQVLGIDIDIREHNRVEIEKHPMFKRITMIEGSSADADVVNQVYERAGGKQQVLVVLDSLHTHDHVLKEMEAYSPLVRKGGYLVVFDTVIQDMPAGYFSDRPWDKGNNPKTAVWEFLRRNDRFMIDKDIANKLLTTAAPDGYLKCVKD